MYPLNQQQVELIRQEVLRQDIHLGHLVDELVDHLCCDIEEMIWEGSDFQQAYQRVMEKVKDDGLQQIQKDTLFITDKSYRIMKNAMKITGVAGMALIAIGIVLRIEHLFPASIFLTAGFFLLVPIFFPVSVMVLRKESKDPGMPLIYLTALIGGLLLMIAVLLKVMHWPGANPAFIAGYGTLSLGLIPALLVHKLKRNPESKVRAVYILGVVAFFFCLVGMCFKVLHYPGARVILTFGTLLLTAVFYPVYSYRNLFKGEFTDPRFLFFTIGIFYFNLLNLLLAVR